LASENLHETEHESDTNEKSSVSAHKTKMDCDSLSNERKHPSGYKEDRKSKKSHVGKAGHSNKEILADLNLKDTKKSSSDNSIPEDSKDKPMQA